MRRCRSCSTQIIHANLAALDALPTSAKQQTEAAVRQAQADPASDRAALIARLEAAAQQAEASEEGSPYLAIAAHLRALVAQLRD